MAEEERDAPGHAQYTGPQQPGVWRPNPEDSFKRGFGDVPGLFDGEKEEKWKAGIAAFLSAREKGMTSETFESTAAEVIEATYLPIKKEEVAPHVLAQFQICQYVDPDSAVDVYRHYEENTNRLRTAVLMPKPKPKPPQISPQETQQVTDSQTPIAQLAVTGGGQVPKKTPGSTPEPTQTGEKKKVIIPPGETRKEGGSKTPIGVEEYSRGREERLQGLELRPGPRTRGLSAEQAQAAQGFAKSLTSEQLTLAPKTWNHEELRQLILKCRGANDGSLAQELRALMQNYQPPRKPAPTLPPSLKGYTLQKILKDFPGLSETDTPGRPSLLISQGNPMAGTTGMTGNAAHRLGRWVRDFPAGQNPQNQPLFSSMNASAFQKLAKQIVQGPSARGDDAGLHSEVGKFIFCGGRSFSELECNEFVPAIYLHKDSKGQVTLAKVGDLRVREDLDKFAPAFDSLTADMDRFGDALNDEQLKAHKTPATDSGNKLFYNLPVFFPLGLRIFVPPIPTVDGRFFKFFQWEIPADVAVDPTKLEPGDPLFIFDEENDRLDGAWFMAFCDFPNLSDGRPIPTHILYEASDVDALAAGWAKPRDKKPAENTTRFAFLRFMGGFQGGTWTPVFFPLSELRAVRYHIMQNSSYAKKAQERYICRELKPGESPAGMLFTPGYYPSVATEGKKLGAKPPTGPPISIYSEYITWLDRRFPPFPSARTRSYGETTQVYRWFQDYQLPETLLPYATPNAPRGIQTWVAEMWDQQADQESAFCYYNQDEVPIYLSYTELQQATRNAAKALTEAPSKRSAGALLGPSGKKTRKRSQARSSPPAETATWPNISEASRDLAVGGPGSLLANLNALLLQLPAHVPGAIPSDAVTFREWLDLLSELNRVVPQVVISPLPRTRQPVFGAFLQLAIAVSPVSQAVAQLFLRLAEAVMNDSSLAKTARAWLQQNYLTEGGTGGGDEEGGNEEDPGAEEGGNQQAEEEAGYGAMEGMEFGGEGEEGREEGGQEQGGSYGGLRRHAVSPPHRSRSASIAPSDSQGRNEPPPLQRGRSRSPSATRSQSSSPSGSPPRRTARILTASPLRERPARAETTTRETLRYAISTENSL